MKLKELKGVYPALITPFKKNGAIDEAGFRHNIDYVIEGGVAGIVPCGCTGEAATLRFIGGEGGGDLDVAETEKSIVRIGDDEAVLVLVGHGIPALRGHHEIVHAVSIEISDELRRPSE